MSKPSTCKFTPFLHRCRVACEPERHSTQESGRQTQKWRLKRLRPLWPLHRTRRWLATSCDRYCRTANQRSLIVKKTLFKYATSFHEMENFPWCASPRAFQRYQIWEASPMLIKMTNVLKCGQLCCCAPYLFLYYGLVKMTKNSNQGSDKLSGCQFSTLRRNLSLREVTRYCKSRIFRMHFILRLFRTRWLPLRK